MKALHHAGFSFTIRKVAMSRSAKKGSLRYVLWYHFIAS
jgi:hypothetical protein